MKNLIRHGNEKFELLAGSDSLPDIQDYFEYNFKKHGKKTDNLSIRIYANKIKNSELNQDIILNF